ncbi:MAG: hypothetical protein PVSMB4_06540 [Ktedonobacterales bacterium]
MKQSTNNTDPTGATGDPEPGAPLMPATTSPARTWVCPGVPYHRRVLTGIGVVAAAAVFFLLALWQGASMLVSTLIGVVFIGGFVGYLVVVAPVPFTLTVDAAGLVRAERGSSAPSPIPWQNVAKVKEERFKSGKAVSLTVYKRVGERGLHRSFVVYRDDIPDFDGFLAALRAGVPEERPWLGERVHE